MSCVPSRRGRFTFLDRLHSRLRRLTPWSSGGDLCGRSDRGGLRSPQSTDTCFQGPCIFPVASAGLSILWSLVGARHGWCGVGRRLEYITKTFIPHLRLMVSREDGGAVITKCLCVCCLRGTFRWELQGVGVFFVIWVRTCFDDLFGGCVTALTVVV